MIRLFHIVALFLKEPDSEAIMTNVVPVSKYQFKTKGEDKCFRIQDVKLGLKYGMKMVTYWIILFEGKGVELAQEYKVWYS